MKRRSNIINEFWGLFFENDNKCLVINVIQNFNFCLLALNPKQNSRGELKNCHV